MKNILILLLLFFTRTIFSEDIEERNLELKLFSAPEALKSFLDEKVYFAGETYNSSGINPVDGFYIIRGSVQSAVISAVETVEKVLEE